MSDTKILTNISEMIDLAIGSPEVGMVDFNMLQTVLHCLAQQLRVLGKNVELRGVGSMPNMDNTQTIAISEFAVDTDEGGAGTHEKIQIAPQQAPSDQDTILVVERIRKSESPTGTRESKPASEPEKRSSKEVASKEVAPRQVTSTEKLSLVTLSKFNLLENTVEDLRNRVYGSLPKNEQILEEVRSQTNLKAITDMWTSLNVSARLEAAETGLSKLSSLLQDLITESGKTVPELYVPPAADQASAGERSKGEATSGSSQAGKGIEDFATLRNEVETLKQKVEQLVENFGGVLNEMESAEASIDVMRQDVDNEVETASEVASSAGGKGVGAESKTGTSVGVESTGGGPHLVVPSGPAAGGYPKRKHGPARGSMVNMMGPLNERINEMEKRMKICCENVNKVEGTVQDQLTSFQDQLEYLLKQVTKMTEGPDCGRLSPELIKDLQGLLDLFQTVQDMRAQLDQVHETALQLAGEKDARQSHMNALLEQIELLKAIKLDREDMVEAMAEKADVRLLARKVSRDQFDMALDDLTRGIEHTIGKLNMQESLWQQALDDIQREIETKLDKMELSPVKDFFNSKLKQLQENLRQLSSLRREVEAAGAKKRLLRDVNCISCDAQAVMSMEAPSTIPAAKAMPPNLSMKPYLSYELDTIRKQQASNLPQRNMHDWENLDKQLATPKQAPRTKSAKHLCNRYCGGSHTVTTPAQRVARLGHFVKQWGPDVLPLSSGYAAGDDGRLYKVTVTEEQGVGPGGAVDATCTPKPPPKEPAKPLEKPIVISPECRCLEGGTDVANKKQKN